MQSREYDINKVITFRKTTEKFGGLSNMAAGYSLNINGNIIPTAEHLYQAFRFPLFPKVQELIINEPSPMTAKMISRKYISYTRQDWEEKKIKIMRWVLQVKLSQNWNKFSTLLLETENKPIVEFSQKDKLWAAVKDNGKLVGVNALGRLLMELRDKYVHSDNCLNCVEPLYMPGFVLYDHPIEWICDESYTDDIYQSEKLLELV